MLQGFTRMCVLLAQKCLPDSFVLVVILTLIVFGVSMPLTHQGPLDMINHWGKGAWSLLGFSMQMALVLVLGQTLASAKILQNLLKKLASIPSSPFYAIAMVTFLGLLASWINWGFGLVISAIFAKEIAKSNKGVDYRLLIAAAYSGFVIWHGGLSGSIPLTLASGGDVLVKTSAGVLNQAIPVSQTIFSTYSILIILILFLCLPFILAFIHPKKKDVVEVNKALLEESKEKELITHKNEKTLADYLENSALISFIISNFGVIYIISHFARGGSLNLDIVNMIFLFIGILLHKTPIAYVRSINKAARSVAGILLQFPFYAGIMGMMVGASASGDSLASLLSLGFAKISTEHTFALFTFLSAGIVNIFVPSGGGQWAVQAPIMLPAGMALGVDPSVVSMAIAWGDAWTNMIQPFWALPALAIAGLGAKDIMGYCVVTLLFVGLVVCGVFLFVS